MWWEFHRLMDLDAGAARRRGRPDRAARAGRPDRRGRRRASRPGATRFPDQDYDLGRGDGLRSGPKAGARRTTSPFNWAVGEVVGDRSGRARPSTSGAPSAIRTRGRSCRSTGSGRRTTRRALLELGEWVADHGDRRRRTDIGRPATCSSGGRRASVRRPARRSREPASRPRRRAPARPRARPHDARRSRARPASGKTYTRRPDDLHAAPAAGKRVGITGTSHKVIGNLLGAVLEAAAAEGVDVRADPARRRRARSVDGRRGSSRAKDAATTSEPGWTTGESNLAAGTSWLWASAKMVDAVDVLFVDEAGQISLANVVAIARGDREPRAARRPAAARPADCRARTRPAPSGRRSPTSSASDATMPPDRGLFLETTWRLHPDLCALHVRGLLRRPARARGAPRRPAPRRGRRAPRRRRPAACVDVRDDRRRQRVARRGRRRRRRWRAAIVEGGATWIDATARSSPIGWEDVLIVAPYNAQVGAITPAARPTGPGSGPSTSSRARRRRSASTR